MKLVAAILILIGCAGFLGPLEAAAGDVSRDACLDVAGVFEAQDIRACIAMVSSLIDQEKSGNERAQLLSVRAELHAKLAREEERDGAPSAAEFDTALNDYDAALALIPDNREIRKDKAQYLLDLGRFEAALKEVERLLQMKPASIEYLEMKAQALLGMRRFKETIDVTTSALPLTGQCAEAVKIQRAADRLKKATIADNKSVASNAGFTIYAFDPIPEALDPKVLAMGFTCEQSPGEDLRAAVTGKPALLRLRGLARQGDGDTTGAIEEFLASQRVGDPAFNDTSYEICALATDVGQWMTAATFCRRWMETYSMPAFVFSPFGWPDADPKVAARIAKFLLEDGDVRDACRIVRSSSLQPAPFKTDPNLKALRKRVAAAEKLIDMHSCELETPNYKPAAAHP